MSQHPQGLSDLADLIQCGEVYDCFDNNTVEVDIMLDYLTAQRLTPRHIYREVRTLPAQQYSEYRLSLLYRSLTTSNTSRGNLPL